MIAYNVYMGSGLDRLLRGALAGSIALATACATAPVCSSYQRALQRAKVGLNGAAEARSAFGTIDRPVEAVWVVEDAGHHPIAHACLTDVVTETAGGYAVKATCIVGQSPRCEDGRYLQSTCVFMVKPDGTFESVAVTHPDPVTTCLE